MNDLQDLKKRISEIVSDLNAGQVEMVTHSHSGGYRETSGGGYWLDGEETWETEEFVPDESRRSKGRQKLETLVRSTEPALLVQVPEPVVLNKVGEVYGTDATSHFINAFNEQKAEPLRNAMVKFGDKRVLPVLRDASSIDGYVSVFTRLNDGNTLVKQLVSGDISPVDFRRDVAGHVRAHLKVVSEEYEQVYHTLERMADPQYWNLNLNDLNLSLRLVEKDPNVVQEVFDHPSDPKNWEFHPYTCELIDWNVGTAAIPVLMGIMTSEKYPHHLRSYAAAELRKIDDPETNKTLLAMMETPNCRYATKALVRTHHFDEDVTPKRLSAFFLHYREIDDGDFGVTIESSKQNLPILIDALIDSQRDTELKAKILDSFVECAWWFRLDNQSKFDEEMRKLADYYVSSGYEESDFYRLFSGRTGKRQPLGQSQVAIAILRGLYEAARNEDKDVELRERALGLIRENGKGWINWDECRDVKSYLRRAGSRLFGRFFEPNEKMRLAAKEAYSKVK